MSDEAFGSSAQDDTTGLGIWAASIVLARWAVDLGAARLGGRVVRAERGLRRARPPAALTARRAA